MGRSCPFMRSKSGNRQVSIAFIGIQAAGVKLGHTLAMPWRSEHLRAHPVRCSAPEQEPRAPQALT